jgi:hypothetical protein
MYDNHEVDNDKVERNIQDHLDAAARNNDKGSWWIFVVVGAVSAYVMWFIWSWRGFGLWLIAAIVVLLLALVPIRSALYAAIVLIVGAVVLFIYFLIAYQTV